MNALVLQILAARANGNPAVAELVARMRDGSGSNSDSDLREMLLRQAGNNPLASLLAKQYTEAPGGQGSAAVIDVEAAPEKPRTTDHAHEAPHEASSEMPTKARDQIEDLTSELNVIRERNDLLASALGACCCCWGQDPQCRLCRGRGRPGFSIPDERLFREFVLPAVQMLRAQRAGISGSSPPTNSKTAETNA